MLSRCAALPKDGGSPGNRKAASGMLKMLPELARFITKNRD